MVPHFLGFMCKIIRVNSDAMSADKTGFKREKVPLGTRSFQYIHSIYAQPVENKGKLVYKRNINITLGIFYNLCRFCNTNTRREKSTGNNNLFVEVINDFCGLRS